MPQADVPSDKPADGPSHAANIHEQSSAQISNGHSEEQSHVHSRLLTKQQIRDMAFGIREMSQQLGHLRVIFYKHASSHITINLATMTTQQRRPLSDIPLNIVKGRHYTEYTRRAIINCSNNGLSANQTAKVLQCAPTTAKRIIRQYRTTEQIIPQPRPGRPQKWTE